MKCESCGAEMKPLWLMTSLFCPNECDLKKGAPLIRQVSETVVIYLPRNTGLWASTLSLSLGRGRTPRLPGGPPGRGILYHKHKHKFNDYEIHVSKEHIDFEGIAVLDATVGNAPVVRVKPNVPVLYSDHPKFKPCK